MSRPATYPSFGYDLFAASTKSSLPDVNSIYEKVVQRLPFLASEQGRREEIDKLLALPHQYRVANWDGEGAAPIREAAINEARVFLRKLPASTPLPEAIPEPDGYLGLEWYANKSLLYVLSFNGTGALSCSGLIGPERIYGTRYMDQGIPTEILRNIASILR